MRIFLCWFPCLLNSDREPLAPFWMNARECECDDLVQWIVTMDEQAGRVAYEYITNENTPNPEGSHGRYLLAVNRRNHPSATVTQFCHHFFLWFKLSDWIISIASIISTNSWFRQRRIHSIWKLCLLSFCDSSNTHATHRTHSEPHKCNGSVCVLLSLNRVGNIDAKCGKPENYAQNERVESRYEAAVCQ